MSRAFNGTTDRADHTAGSPVSGYPFTIAGWAKPNIANANLMVAQLQHQARSFPRHFIRCAGAPSENPIEVQSKVVSDLIEDAAVAATPSFLTGGWQHVAGAWSGPTDRSVWLGGANRMDNTTITQAWDDPSFPIDSVSVGVAGDSSPDNFFDGSLAHIAIWNIALSEAEIVSLASGAHPYTIQKGSIIAYWPLAGTASPEPDEIGNFDLTLTGTTQGADEPPVDPIPQQVGTVVEQSTQITI